MTYDSESGRSDKSSDNATNTEEEAWNNGCRDLIITDKLTYITSNIKEHKLSSKNLDTALHDAHLLNGENTSYTSRECNVLKAKGKENPKFSIKDLKKKSRDIDLL